MKQGANRNTDTTAEQRRYLLEAITTIGLVTRFIDYYFTYATTSQSLINQICQNISIDMCVLLGFGVLLWISNNIIVNTLPIYLQTLLSSENSLF